MQLMACPSLLSSIQHPHRRRCHLVGVADAAPLKSRPSRDEGDAEERRRRRQRARQQRQRDQHSYSYSGDADAPNNKQGQFNLGTLVTTTKPRDVTEGLLSATANVVRCTLVGILSLFAFPIAGAKQSGLLGFVLGGVGGVILGALIPVMGAIGGLQQVVWGIGNTLEAMRSSRRGLVWDAEERVWVEYVLDDEAREVRYESASKESGGGGGGSSSRSVKDTRYYDLLNVPPNSTPSQIKRAYYREAKVVHPDKNADDAEEAAEKFRELSVAYQVLSDPKKRAEYDRRGASKSDADDLGQQFDPYVFFAILFGSELVEPYIGELRIASFADTLFRYSKSETKPDLATFFGGDSTMGWAQRKRQVEVALKLRERVGPFVTGTMSEADFVDGCKEEAQAIIEGGATFGGIFLTTIGRALTLNADEYLGYHKSILGWRGRLSWMKRKARGAGGVMNTASSFVGLVRESWGAYSSVRAEKEFDEDDVLDEVLRESGGGGGARSQREGRERATVTGEELVQRMGERSLPAVLDLAWAINVRDITKTLREACHKLFSDAGASSSMRERLKRAEAVRLIGREFLAAGRAHGAAEGSNATAKKGGRQQCAANDEIRARAEVAFEATMKKAQGQDVPRATDAEDEIKRKRMMAENELKRKKKRAAARAQ